jgi:PAS domain S-box-containing protein
MPNTRDVFVVDDEPRTVERITAMLWKGGLAPHGFTSAKQFLDQCTPGMTGCLLLDLRMPELDGLTVIERLSDMSIRLPTVILTGVGSVAACTRAFHLGVVDFLEKPIEETALVECIENVFACPDEAEVASNPSAGRSSHALADLLHGMLEKWRLGIALTDGKGRFLAANPALCSFLGYTIDELLGKSVADVTLPSEIAAEGKLVRAATLDSLQLEKHYVAKDGTVLPARVTCNLIRNASGQIDYALGIVEDLSKQADPAMAKKIEAYLSYGDQAPVPVPRRPRLTKSEEEVLELLVAGKSLKQIAVMRRVTLQAVWKHQQHILKKFAVENEVELVRLILGVGVDAGPMPDTPN